MDTEIFIQIPTRQDEQETFPRRGGHLTTWAKQERRPERVELSLPLVGRRTVSVDSWPPDYARMSS